ncbi:PREDICTED: uncharacterized protein LOC109163781 [Ipomoea nil]|uniref:uncharacterized protein LOC109163781 n=1 Tax=Ipomoea nil TaxID=35883 RepID=UPI0009012D4C|nr:PREDICTED: uncharacterized protein LOC109163781 [Ipomoea nil]
MECHSEKGNGIDGGFTSNQAKHSSKFGDRVMFERPEVSNFNRGALENGGVVPPRPAKLGQKKRGEKKGSDDEEVVRYMSSLPSYLQRGKSQHEKAFNVGVLDWRHLERWQSKHKQIPSSTSGFSPSSSNTSSFSSTEESSSNSSSGHSCSPSNHPTLQSHLFSSEKLRGDLKPCQAKPSKVQQSVPRSTLHDSIEKVEELSKHSECHHATKTRKSQDIKVDISISKSKGKMMILDGEPFMKVDDKLCSSQSSTTRRSFSTGIKLSSKPNEPSISPGKRSSTPPRSWNLQNPPRVISSRGSNPKEESLEPTARSPSPSRWFGITMGRIDRTSNAKGTSTMPPDKADAKNRAASTPLRRLLEPLLKPKTGSSDNFTGLFPGDSTSRDKRSKSAPRRGESLTPYMMKVKLDLKGCKTIEIGDPSPAGRHGPSTMRALLQVAIKNSVPLYKFAVENEGNVIAATMKHSISSTKEKNNLIYTFFTIHETKKKDRNGYIPSVIAQMKVSDVPFPDVISQKSGYQSIIREFVLFTMGVKQAGQQTADPQLNDELAAIVVKVGMCSETQDVNMNVILPGGNHGIPRKGEPSSLIERWKSGGSCDCGGWDLGCKLGILANHNGTSRESSSTKVSSNAEPFELYPQGEDQENKPALRLFPFKNGIFSVEYTSSLKTLQAFSICLAVLNTRKQDGFCESGNAFGEDSSRPTMVSNVSNKAQAEFPGKRVSIPPLSPVGRV